MALTTITLHGEILTPVTNVPAVGTVTFKIVEELRDNADNIIYSPQTFVATLDVNGEFSIVLPVTDQATVTPLNWSYWCYVDTDIWVSGVFYFQLPESLGPVAEFADIIEIDGTGFSCTPDGTACAPIGALGALQEQIDAIETEIEGFQTQIDDLQTEVDLLESQITGFQTQIDALDVRADDLEADVLALQGQVTTINGQITTIQGQITTMQGQIASLQATEGALVTTVNIHTGQINTLNSQMATAQADILALQGNVTTLQGQMTTVQGQITTLQGQVGTLITDLDALELQAVVKDPTVAGTYVGNIVVAPPNPAGTNPWLRTVPIPYSGPDSNFDFLRVLAIDEFGNTVQTFTLNGNGEGRSRPSSRTRVGWRSFESAQAVGYSTDQFWQASSNPTVSANREPYLGVFGSAHATKPGWAEATRVLSGLAGVSIGGTANAALAPYNTLSAFNYRGLKTSAGPPAAGTWIANDVVLDSAGVVYRCTVGGTPGTWVGVNAPTAFTNLGSLNANIVLGAGKSAASRLDRGADNVRLRGFLTATAGVASNAVLGNITAAHRPTVQVDTIARYTGGGARLTITAGGNVSINAALVLNDNLWLDGVTYDQLP